MTALLTLCPNCGAPVKAAAAACPDCGRVLIETEPATPPTSVAPRKDVSAEAMTAFRLPMDDLEGFDKGLMPLVLARWEFEPLPGGGVRLKRNAAGRLEWDSGSWTVGLILPLLLLPVYFMRGGVGYAAERPILFWSGIVLAGIVGVLGLAGAFLRREEIRAGKGFVERSVQLFGYGRTDRMDGMGVFRVVTQNVYAGRGSRRSQRVLKAENLGKKFVLDRESEPAGLMSGGLLGDLLGGTATDTRPDEMTALGKYLSAVTGWPLIDPDKGIF